MVTCPNCRSQLEVDRFELDETVVACPDCKQTFRLGDVRHVKVLKKRRNVGNDAAAFFISLIVPGSGHLIKGKGADGLVWFLAAVACFIVALSMNQQPFVGAFGAALVGIVAALSACRA